jgi:hypothetical protein
MRSIISHPSFEQEDPLSGNLWKCGFYSLSRFSLDLEETVFAYKILPECIQVA